jgi:hypothetical protein
MIRVELQHFHGCPNGPELLSRTREAVAHCRERVDFREVVMDTPELAVRHRFRGSPTLLINGEDFTGLPAPEESLLSCRIYPDGLPTVAEIIAKIEAAE